MKHKIIIPGSFPSLNEFIDANRRGKGNWNKGNSMKQYDQITICKLLRSQFKKLHIKNKVYIQYRFFEKNKRRDLDNVSGYFHKVFQDALVQCGIIENDNWQHIIGFSDEFFVDGENPRIEITIVEMIIS